MAAENIIFNRRATLAWQSSSGSESRQAQSVQIDPSIALRLVASPGGRPAPGRPGARARRATPLQVLHDIGVPRRTVREPPQALGTCGPERPAGKDASRSWHFTTSSKGRRLSQRYAVCSFRRRVACVAQSSGPAGFPGFSWLPRLPHKYTTAVVDPSTTYLRYRRYLRYSRWHTLIKAGV